MPCALRRFGDFVYRTAGGTGNLVAVGPMLACSLHVGEADTEESSREGGGGGPCAGSTAAAAGGSDRALNTKRRLGGGPQAGCRRRRRRIRGGMRRTRCGAFVRVLRALLLCQLLLMTTCVLNTTPLPPPQIAGIGVLGLSALKKRQRCKLFLNI